MHFSNFSGIQIAVGLLFSTIALHAEEARDHNITLDDYFTLAYLPESVISPSGQYVAYAEALWQESTDNRKADIWVVKTTTGEVDRLTFDRAGDSSLIWSQDSKYLYFAGNRTRGGITQPPYDGTTQVWRVPVDGGEPLAITRVPGGIEVFDLSTDGHTLYYTTTHEDSPVDWSSLRSEFKRIKYGRGPGEITEVNKLDLQNWRTEKVATLGRAVSELSVSPDGRRLALITAPENAVISFEGQSQIEVIQLFTQEVKVLPDELWRARAPSRYGRLESVTWSKDGQALSFIVAFDGYPSEIIIANSLDEQPVIFILGRPAGVSLHADVGTPLIMRWRKASSELCFLGEEKGRTRVYSAANVGPNRTPEYRCMTPGDIAVDSFSLDSSGDHMAATMGDPTHFPDICLLDPSGEFRRLTNVNPQTKNWKLPKISVVSWKGANDVTVEGILELPADSPSEQRLPMIVSIHGGPTASQTFQLLYDYYGHGLYSANGYAVLSPNYRGSTGYGDQFLTDLIGRENDIEVEDILKGVDAMVEKRIADPNHLGISGWSNGGYLTNCLITKTNRFKAASSGASIADMLLEWGTTDEPAYPMAFVQGLPWAKPAAYQKASPVFNFGAVRTPTLFHVGENDPRCSPVNSRTLYRSLKEYVRLPTELLVYPNEPHNLQGYQSRKAKMAWDLAWFRRYIDGEKN